MAGCGSVRGKRAGVQRHRAQRILAPKFLSGHANRGQVWGDERVRRLVSSW